MTTWIYSQEISLSQEQKDRLLYIATPIKLQEWADNKLAVKQLDSIVKAKESNIVFLKMQIENLKLEYQKSLYELAQNNTQIANNNEEIEDITEKIIKNSKWDSFHLKIGIEQEYKQKINPIFKTILLFKLHSFEFGATGKSNKQILFDINYYIF